MAPHPPPGQATAKGADSDIQQDGLSRLQTDEPFKRRVVAWRGQEDVLLECSLDGSSLLLSAGFLANGLPAVKFPAERSTTKVCSMDLGGSSYVNPEGRSLRTLVAVQQNAAHHFELFHPGGIGVSAQLTRQAVHATFAAM